jgi:hypothetical protein
MYEGVRNVMDRRDAVRCALIALGAVALPGCAGGARRGRTAALPGPIWPHERHTVLPEASPAPVRTETAAAVGRAQIIPRAQWTSARPDLADTVPMVRVERITVHHDGLEPMPISSAADAARRIETIRRAHVEHNGWADIGYHFVIDPQGRVWEGRPLDRQGAHVRDNNPRNMGVLVLGHFNVQKPTPRALATLDGFLAEAAVRFRVPMNRIRTHQEIVSTECPGTNLQAHMTWTRSPNGRLGTSLARA